jgi:large subunit ribosomal protein L31
MKQEIHPEFHTDAVVRCACGNTWTTGSTAAEIRTDVCAACHPFFTGEQRIVDTEGRVDRFYRRLEQARVRQGQSSGAAEAEEAEE